MGNNLIERIGGVVSMSSLRIILASISGRVIIFGGRSEVDTSLWRFGVGDIGVVVFHGVGLNGSWTGFLLRGGCESSLIRLCHFSGAGRGTRADPKFK